MKEHTTVKTAEAFRNSIADSIGKAIFNLVESGLTVKVYMIQDEIVIEQVTK